MVIKEEPIAKIAAHEVRRKLKDSNSPLGSTHVILGFPELGHKGEVETFQKPL